MSAGVGFSGSGALDPGRWQAQWLWIQADECRRGVSAALDGVGLSSSGGGVEPVPWIPVEGLLSVTAHFPVPERGSCPARSDYDLEYECYQDDFYDRVYDYQRVPASVTSVPHGPGLAKRSRTSSSGLRRSRDRPLAKGSSRTGSSSSSRAKLKMEELQTIKRELTLIKVQIDGLLESLDRMDRQRRDRTGSPPTREGSLTGSPYLGPASSPEGTPNSHSPHRRARRDREGGESPELGEASDDDRHTVTAAGAPAPPAGETPQLHVSASVARRCARGSRPDLRPKPKRTLSHIPRPSRNNSGALNSHTGLRL
ncbi:hypothetical protein COCON_G00218800 [Conger conger]|uniref:Uncharacterized protein n=1 Tax=Conger conger TaxID=82655 RepID=A0A9Q1CYK7_CONCO|nr:hypothetical protein COCON_G00218800 [Conger conger]